MFGRKSKIFCIGRNKTGTTSIKLTLEEHGFKSGDQHKAERLLKSYISRDFDKIIKFCKTGDFFQDIPFSLPYTFIHLDRAFPKSKFILTIRGSSDEWYDSFIRWQIKRHGNGKLPTYDELARSTYAYPGFALDTKMKVFGTSRDDLYNKEILIRHYEFHNYLVGDYFKNRESDLLTINLSDPSSYKKLCKFLDLKPQRDSFPWINKSIE